MTNSGTFLGYHDEHGNEMHCSNAFCPHQDKCLKRCIAPVSRAASQSNSSDTARDRIIAKMRSPAGNWDSIGLSRAERELIVACLRSDGVAQGKQDRPEVAHAEAGDPAWPEHFSCDFDTSAPHYTITWKSDLQQSSKWLAAMPDGKIVVGEVDLVDKKAPQPVSFSIDGLLAPQPTSVAQAPSTLADRLEAECVVRENHPDDYCPDLTKMFRECVVALRSSGHAYAPLTSDQVEWVVNDIAELGVKIGDQFFFIYKGHSLVYGDDDESRAAGVALNSDTDPPKQHMWRPVFKREFGECAHPINHKDYSKIGTVSLDDSDEWKPLPASALPSTDRGGK